ncbi:type 2 periplasmic-binding domain-containing protein [Microbacterium gorillae]|uniref:extracellular solute-binding protein n=1 Tax=Microbacterium gorillae TaxID=1231063 RepID=UPI00058BFC2B|nr:extracellular solute-binding protein [Microbacterium gorillae]
MRQVKSTLRLGRRRTLRRSAIALAGSVIAGLVLAGCSAAADPKPTEAPAAVTKFSTERDVALKTHMDELYAEAVASGNTEVVFGFSDVPSMVDGFPAMVDAFHEFYPDIKITLKPISFGTFSSIVMTEEDTGQRTADLLYNSLLALSELMDADRIKTDIDWTALGADPARADAPGQIALGDGTCVGAIYNKQFVNEADLPDEITGFTDPKWKGMLTSQAFNAYACWGFRALATDLDDTLATLKTLTSQNGLSFNENTFAQQVASGERPVMLMGNHQQASYLKDAGMAAEDIGLKLYPGTGVFRQRGAVVASTKALEATELWSLFMTTDLAQPIWWDDLVMTGFLGDPESKLTKLLNEAAGGTGTESGFFVVDAEDNYRERIKAMSAIQALVTE